MFKILHALTLTVTCAIKLPFKCVDSPLHKHVYLLFGTRHGETDPANYIAEWAGLSDRETNQDNLSGKAPHAISGANVVTHFYLINQPKQLVSVA